MDEWLCLSNPGRYWGVNLPLRTKSAVCSMFVFLWHFFCAYFCKGAYVSWCWWILTVLHDIVCVGWLEKLFPGRLIPPSPFYLGS